MRIKVLPLILAGIIILSTIFSCLIGFVSNAANEEELPEVLKPGVAADGVSINGISIAGMTVNEVGQVISQIVHGYDNTVFTLVVGNDEMEATGKDLSIIPVNSDIAETSVNYGKNGNLIERFVANCDINSGKKKDYIISFTSDWNKTKDYLEENTAHLESAPVNNSIKRESGGFTFIEGKTGVTIDCETSASKIAEFVMGDWNGNDARIELETMVAEPKGSREELMQVKDLLGSCSTDFHTSTAARAANVKNGTSKLNGKLIFPGEEFSVSTNLESRNAANGYLPAPSYENGTTVDTYGGGVCQISSTLYNAVIRSELEIVERHPHSMVVSYVKPSMDAAISEGSKDLRFKNNKNYPIYIEGYTSGGMLYFNIFGKEERAAGRKVSYESEILTTTEPDDKFIAKEDLPVGKVVREQSKHTGYTAKLWKVVTENGQEVSRETFNNSTYRPSSAIYSVGMQSDVAGAREAMAAAIATNDRENIKAVAAQWASGEGGSAGNSGGEAGQATNIGANGSDYSWMSGTTSGTSTDNGATNGNNNEEPDNSPVYVPSQPPTEQPGGAVDTEGQ